MGETAKNYLCSKGEPNKVDETIWKHLDEDLCEIKANNCCSIMRRSEWIWLVLMDYFGSYIHHISNDADRAC